MRRLLAARSEQPGFDVVGAGSDGDEALALCARQRPDVMTLDLAMPGLDGIDVLRAPAQRRARRPGRRRLRLLAGPRRPRRRRARRGRLRPRPQARRRRAVRRPSPTSSPRSAAAPRPPHAGVRAAALAAATPPRPATPAPARPRRRSPARTGTPAALVVIACSTGGPRALAELVPALPSPLGAGTLIVQHMPPGLHRLARRAPRPASRACTSREAAGGDPLEPGVALLAPGGTHLRLDGDRRVAARRRRRRSAACARAPTSRSPTPPRVWASASLLVVLTGMGSDGLEGARPCSAAGGRVLVEADVTCTVYGMPRAVAEAGLADVVAAAARAGRRHRRGGRRDEPLLRAPTPVDDYVDFCEGVRRLSGIDLTQYKRGQMERRIRSFAERRGARRLADLPAASCARDTAELDEFLDRVTINVSQLWRNPEQCDALRHDVLPELAADGRCAPGAPAAPTAPRPTRWPPSAATPSRRARRDRRHRHRPPHGRARPRRRASPPRTPATRRAAELARFFEPATASGWQAERRAARAWSRFEVGDLLRLRPRDRRLRPRPLPQHRHLLQRGRPRRAPRAPRGRAAPRRRTSSSAPPSASPTPRRSASTRPTPSPTARR